MLRSTSHLQLKLRDRRSWHDSRPAQVCANRGSEFVTLSGKAVVRWNWCTQRFDQKSSRQSFRLYRNNYSRRNLGIDSFQELARGCLEFLKNTELECWQFRCDVSLTGRSAKNLRCSSWRCRKCVWQIYYGIHQRICPRSPYLSNWISHVKYWRTCQIRRRCSFCLSRSIKTGSRLISFTGWYQ